MEGATGFIEAINFVLGYFILAISTLALLFLVLWDSYRQIRTNRRNLGIAIFRSFVAFLEALLFIVLFILLPERLPGSPHLWRWILLYLTLPGLAAFYFRKYRGKHAFRAIVVILTIALIGWLYGKWLGIFFISLPIYGIGLLFIYNLAQVVLPSNNPEDRRESIQKFRMLLFYVLGMQYPYWAVKGRATHEVEKRIDGDFFVSWAKPGAIWTYSHQVVGVSAGIYFDNIEGPGIVFTDTYQRPIAVVDLRTQLRTAEVEAVTRDGVPIRAVVFASFALDRENWPKKNWRSEDLRRLSEDVKANPHLAQGLEIDRPIGSYPYSTGRVRAALSMTSIHSSYEERGDKIIHWDEWVVAQIKNAARRVISQRTLNELWHPQQNRPGWGALDEMANEIRTIVEPQLRRAGIVLFGGRIVNYVLSADSQIAKQQIESWKTIWTQKIKALEAEAQAIYQEQIEKAHAYAKSTFLETVATAIQRARTEHPDLPRHVIATYFIHAIEEYLQTGPTDSTQAKQHLETIRNIIFSSNL